MVRFNRRLQGLAICLSAVAGFVDALAFVELGGFFVSFMSGNSTRLGVGLTRYLEAAGLAGVLIGSFVIGVAAGSALGSRSGSRRRVAVLLLVGGLLALAASSANAVQPVLTLAIAAVAMGAVNTVFEVDGEVRIGVTYMTGTLVKIGQQLAIVLQGGRPAALLPYFMLWVGLVAGAALGAMADARLGLSSLWGAAVAALVAALVTQSITEK